jgi:hypothetical protein
MESGQKLSSSVVGQPCPPLAENLYQKFRKLLFYPLNYGTKKCLGIVYVERQK